MNPKAWPERSLTTVNKSSTANGRTGMQLAFTDEASHRLDAIKEAAGHSNKVETIREALRLFEWLVKEAEPDFTLRLIDAHGETVSQFKVGILMGK